MKCFIAAITTRDGDHEYGEQLCVRAKDCFAAGEQTKRYLSEVYVDEGESTWEDNRLDLFDQIIIFEEAREIPEGDYTLLEKYLPVVRLGNYFYKG